MVVLTLMMVMTMFCEVLSFLTGRPVVYLQDHEGEVYKALATQTPFGLTAKVGSRMFTLKEDGTVFGCSYVQRWKLKS